MKTFKENDNIKFCPPVAPYDCHDKASVRRAMLGARQALDADTLQRAEEALASRVLAYVEGRLAKASSTLAGRTSAVPDTLSYACIMSYMSYRNEFPTHLLNSKLLSASCNLVLPFTDANFDITAYHVCDMSELVTSRLGIVEPDTALCHAAAPDDIDIILMPGVAFDASGNRIGFGKGCYDRFIAQCKRHPLIIALAYDFQVVEALPSDAYDIPADVIITEAHIYEPGL